MPARSASKKPAARKGRAKRIALVVGDFNELLTSQMERRALAVMKELGYEPGPIVHVSGTYDVVLPADKLLARRDIAAVVVIAVIITGETKHDELIAHATAKTLQEVSLKHGKPVGLGITGPGQTYEQAEARVDRADAAVDAVDKLLKAFP